MPISNPLGGIKTYILSYARYLGETGFRFTFLAPEGKKFACFQEEAASFPDVEFINVPGGASTKKMVVAIRRAMKTGRFSLVHSQGLKAGFQTALANWGICIPHVMTLHDVILPQNDIPGRFKWFKKRLLGYTTKFIDHIIAVTDDCRENHLQLFPQWKKGPCKVETVLNGIDLDKLLFPNNSDSPANSNSSVNFDSPARIREEFGFDPEMILIGFFGRFMPQKGFLPLLESLEILADRGYQHRIRLIATRDDFGYGEYFEKIRSSETLQNMVRLVSPQNNIASLILQMNLVVMPSLWEACSLVSMEAMILGVPFLGSRCIGIREVIRDTPSRSHQPDDPVSLADAIEEYINHPWDEEARAFAPIARQRFDVRNGVRQVEKIYRSLERNLEHGGSRDLK